MPSGAAFRVLVAELANAGLDPARVCAEAGVDPAVVRDPSRPFGVRKLGRVLARAEAMAGDPHLGLHLAGKAQGRGMLSYVFRAQPNVERGLAEMVRFASAVWGQDDVLRIARRGGDVSVVLNAGDEVPRHAVEFVVARLAIGLRQSGTTVREVAFRHAAVAPADEYRRVLGVPVRFRRPATALRLDASALARPLPTANPDAAAALAAGLSSPSRPGADTAPAAARVGRAVESALANGTSLDREPIARALGMSGRTLARRLAAQGTRFRDITEASRRRVAMALVKEGREPLGEIASRCGFADQAAFGKAFRRWFGAAPSAVRARRRRT